MTCISPKEQALAQDTPKVNTQMPEGFPIGTVVFSGINISYAGKQLQRGDRGVVRGPCNADTPDKDQRINCDFDSGLKNLNMLVRQVTKTPIDTQETPKILEASKVPESSPDLAPVPDDVTRTSLIVSPDQTPLSQSPEIDAQDDSSLDDADDALEFPGSSDEETTPMNPPQLYDVNTELEELRHARTSISDLISKFNTGNIVDAEQQNQR